MLIASTLVPVFTFDMGGRYLSSVLILGAVFLVGAELLRRNPSRQLALRVFLYSLLYLALVFGAMVCDTVSIAPRQAAFRRPVPPFRLEPFMDKQLVRSNFRVSLISTLVILAMTGAGFVAAVIYVGGTP